MLSKVSKLINKLTYPLDIKISRAKEKIIYPVEASKREIEIIDYILSPKDTRNAVEKGAYSLVSIDRLWAVIQATKYIVKNGVKGDFVECGVWRGGCSLAIAMVLDDLKADKRIYLFDTFEGMTEPTKYDMDYSNVNAKDRFIKSKRNDHNEWCYASIEDVKKHFKKLDLEKKATFIKGDVLKTLNEETNLPEEIALLRLDTDWYESTKHEMNLLYPRLQKDGVLLIDDYGDWQGCRKAIDEYLSEHDLTNRCLMWKTDGTGRGLIKK